MLKKLRRWYWFNKCRKCKFSVRVNSDGIGCSFDNPCYTSKILLYK